MRNKGNNVRLPSFNHVSRLVCPDTQQVFIVLAKHTSNCGKPAACLSRLASAVAGAFAAMLPASLLAVDQNVSIAEAAQYVIANGDSLTVTSSGSVIIGGPLSNQGTVRLAPGLTAVSIANQGIIGSPLDSGGIQIDSGTVTGLIQNSGLIEGFNYALGIDGSSVGSVNNSGIIRSHGTGFGAVQISHSVVAGSVSNAGILDGQDQPGLNLHDSRIGAGIHNTGTVLGQVRITGGSEVSAALSNGVAVLNAGSINGALYIDGSLGSRPVFNGSIENSGYLGYGIGIHGGAIVNGDVVNTARGNMGGIIVDESSVSGSLRNQGLITTSSIGIAITSGLVQVAVDNTGAIQADAAGISLSSGQVVGGISNSGSITSTSASGVKMLDDVTLGGAGFLNAAGGAISGANGGIVLGQVSSSAPMLYHSGATVAGNITNNGLVDGANAGGIYFVGSSLTGDIVNARAGSLNGDAGFSMAAGTMGMATNPVNIPSVLNGSFTNNGLVSGDYYGIYLNSSSISGNIINNGTISSFPGSFGILVDGTGSTLGAIVNQAGGLVSGGTIGIEVDDGNTLDSLLNSGVISGGGLSPYSVRVASGAAITDGITVAGDDTARFIGQVFAPNASVRLANGATYTMQGDELFTLNGTSPGFINEGTLGLKPVSNSGYTGTIDGNYSQGAGTTFRFDLADAVTYGRLNVTGNAELANGSIIDVRLNGTPGSSIDAVLVAGGILTTDPSQLTVQDNSAFYNFQASTARNAQELDLITVKDSNGLTDIAAAGRNPGARGVAGALQGMFDTVIPIGMQPVFDRLVSLDEGELDTAMQQMLPAIQGATAQAGLNTLRSMNKIIQSRIESNQGLSSGDVAIDQYLWLRGFGSWANQGSNDGVPGFDSNTQGFVIGADRPINERVRAGVAFTYAKTDIHDNSAVSSSSVDVDSYELVGYGSYNLDAFTDINYQLDVGQHQADSRRDAFAGGVAKADFDSLALHGSLAIGRLLPFSGQTNLSPSLRMDYTHMKTDGYKEHGAALEGLNLDVDSSTIEELLLSADLKLAHQFDDNNRLVANVTVGYDFINEDVQSSSAFVGGGPVFQAEGLDPSPWLWRTGLEWLHDNQKGVELSLRYDHEGRRSDYRNDSLSARVRWEF